MQLFVTSKKKKVGDDEDLNINTNKKEITNFQLKEKIITNQ